LANPSQISLVAVGGAALVNPHYAESIVPGAASNGRRYCHSAQLAAMAIREEACHTPTSAAERGRPDSCSEGAGKRVNGMQAPASALSGGPILAVGLITSSVSCKTRDANDLQLLTLGPMALEFAGSRPERCRGCRRRAWFRWTAWGPCSGRERSLVIADVVR